MKNKRNKSGMIILLCVIVLIPLVGIGLGVIGQYSRLLILETGYRNLQVETQNIICSAQAWALVHQQKLQAAAVGHVFKPDLSELNVSGGECEITILSRTDDACDVQITARAESGTKSWTQRQTCTLLR